MNQNSPKTMLSYDSKGQTFSIVNKEMYSDISKQVSNELFGSSGFSIVKNFISPEIAEQIRKFYQESNQSTFHDQRSKHLIFHGQSLIVYYPVSSNPFPPFLRSLYDHLSIFRNMVYQDQDFYRLYCSKFNLDPVRFDEVYRHQMKHTWCRVSWYKEGDGQYPHLDNYGEIAAFIFLTQKGVHYRGGGLHEFNKQGEAIRDFDSMVSPGDLFMLDQHKLIHGVQPIIDATPGRMLFYVPIIPYDYMKPYFTFEIEPSKIYFSQDNLKLNEITKAYLKLAYSRLMGKQEFHYTRKKFDHQTLAL